MPMCRTRIFFLIFVDFVAAGCRRPCHEYDGGLLVRVGI
jgi:hypothetical protein